MADEHNRRHHLDPESGVLIEDISESRIEEMVIQENEYSQEHSCPKMPDIPETSSSLDIATNREYLRQIGIAYDDTPATLTYDTRFMTAQDFMNMAKYQDNLVPVKQVYDKHRWVEHIYDPNLGGYGRRVSKLRCALCYKYSDYFKIDIDPHKRRPLITTEEGDLKSSERDNSLMLFHHERSAQHTMVVEELKKRNLDKLMNDNYQLSINDYHDTQYEVTIRMIRLVYGDINTYLLLLLFYMYSQSRRIL